MVPTYGYANPDDLFAPVANGACKTCGAETYDGVRHECPAQDDEQNEQTPAVVTGGGPVNP